MRCTKCGNSIPEGASCPDCNHIPAEHTQPGIRAARNKMRKIMAPIILTIAVLVLLLMPNILPLSRSTPELPAGTPIPEALATPLSSPMPQSALSHSSSATMPDKAIIIFTFDDGGTSDYALAYPILSKYGIRGTSYLITKFTDSNTQGKLTWAQVKEMNAYGWVFGCHTYDHKRMTTLSSKEIRQSLERVNQSFRNQGLPEPKITAYPYGSYNKQVVEAVNSYRKQARLAYYRAKFADLKNPYAVDSISADMRSSDQLRKTETLVDKACAEKAVIVFRVHALYKQNPYDTVARNTKILSGCAPQTDSRLFEQLVAYCVQKGCAFMTMEQLMDLY